VSARRNFVKFTFIRVLPEWRRRTVEERAADKREFAAALSEFAEDHLLRTYSLVGTRGDCDLMLRALAPDLDPIHELHVLLNQSGLMRYAEIAHSFLAMTKESVYSEDATPLEPRPGSDARYLIVYPLWKKREWYALAPEERMRVMRGHIETEKRYGHRHQHGLLLRTRRPGVRGVLQRRRARRVPRPRAGAALDGIERLHRVRDPDLHVHIRFSRARAGRARRDRGGGAGGRLVILSR